MNIETLRIFCDVVQHQSFSRGAAANRVSQSAATQSVHRMEQHFGIQIRGVATFHDDQKGSQRGSDRDIDPIDPNIGKKPQET